MLRTRGFGKRLSHEDFFADGIRACVKRLWRYLYPPLPPPRDCSHLSGCPISPTHIVPGTSQGMLDYPVFRTVSNAFLPFLNNPVWGALFQHREQTRQNQAQHSGVGKSRGSSPAVALLGSAIAPGLIRSIGAVFSLCTAQELWGRCPFS